MVPPVLWAPVHRAPAGGASAGSAHGTAAARAPACGRGRPRTKSSLERFPPLPFPPPPRPRRPCCCRRASRRPAAGNSAWAQSQSGNRAVHAGARGDIRREAGPALVFPRVPPHAGGTDVVSAQE
eukprot:4423483-Pyramimonas_sp.AAC.1